jgi:hypothetical protein
VANNLLAAMRNLAPALADRIPGIRWVSPLAMHIALCVTPDAEVEALEAIADELAGVCSEVEPFEIEVRGIFLGPSSSCSTALWAGVQDPSGRLGRMQQEVRDRVQALGFDVTTCGAGPVHVAVALFPPIELSELVRAAIDTLAAEGFGFIRVAHLTVLACRPGSPELPFGVVSRIPFRAVAEVQREPVPAPRTERTERSPELARRARQQIAEVQDEDER